MVHLLVFSLFTECEQSCEDKMMQNKIQLVVLLALTGILSKASCVPYKFILIEELKSWAESQSYCREKHIDLATVQSDEDRAKLKEAANAANFQSFAWIGFYNGIYTWRWSYQNTAISYVKWAYLEPNTPRMQEAYKRQIPDKFKYIQTSMKWREAQLYCRTLYIDLATIADDSENTALATIITENSGLDAWIGLSKNLWLWSDQTNVSLSTVTWQSGQPDNVNGNEECVCAGTEGQMADDTCSSSRAFYCKTPEDRKIQTVRVTVKSSGYLDQSAVMKAIENKKKPTALTISEDKPTCHTLVLSFSEETCEDEMMQHKIQLVVLLAGILSKASCVLYQFILIEELMTWAEAQSYCREKYTALATVQSDEARAKLKEAANAVNFQSVAWIGYYRDVWRWSYQNMMIGYTRWDSSEPDLFNTNKSCVFVSRNGLWADTYCSEVRYFFCRTGKKSYNSSI
ncbi:C-type mannose receptor 2-like protein [Labeo rohita]|uniref:C-type mannose receptor 2-like protein n=1 Tax=Labeo rohita TaxID=84645 RepID=A0A498MR61_LABRO|nr:C-type mannose receptor 2-like protein [Labeo rohita]